MSRSEIFVFGSNLAGRHGAGAAKYAMEVFGAEYGVGEGLTGRAYALPTKDMKLKTRALIDIEISLDKMLMCARVNQNDMWFRLTPVGCGLAGYERGDIWEILTKKYIPENVLFDRHWMNEYDDNQKLGERIR